MFHVAEAMTESKKEAKHMLRTNPSLRCTRFAWAKNPVLAATWWLHEHDAEKKKATAKVAFSSK